MTNLEMFDPTNRNHLRAFEHYCKNGCWPQEMIDFFGEVRYAPFIDFLVKISNPFKKIS